MWYSGLQMALCAFETLLESEQTTALPTNFIYKPQNTKHRPLKLPD